MDSSYTPPTALTVVSCIFLAIGALCLLFIAGDILLRRGWQSMMWIMIPVYIINACYLGPLAIYIYLKYGRPTKPSATTGQTTTHCHEQQTQSRRKTSSLRTTQMRCPRSVLKSRAMPATSPRRARLQTRLRTRACRTATTTQA